MATAANFVVAEHLRDGRPVTIRAIHPDDKALLCEAFKELDEHSIRLRFFGPKKGLSNLELIQATEIDFVRNVALVACVTDHGRERIIGVGRYIARDESAPPSVAEVAFIVEEDYHGQGLASTLLKHLVRIGREQGILQFQAEVLPANQAMLGVFERSGLRVETNASRDLIHVTMHLKDDGWSK